MHAIGAESDLRAYLLLTVAFAACRANFHATRECSMKKLIWMPVAAVALCLLPAQAHFTLVEPASWIVETNPLGDPQKLAPCGGTSQNPGAPSGALTEVMGGLA